MAQYPTLGSILFELVFNFPLLHIHYNQVFSKDLKCGHSKCAIGSTQMNKFIRQHVENSMTFFNIGKWPSIHVGRLDTHLAEGLIMILQCILPYSRTKELIKLCNSRKYPYPPQGRLMEIPRGRGVSEAQFFKGKYGTKLEFPEGVGVQAKKPSVRGVWIFSGTTHCTKGINEPQNIYWIIYRLLGT